MNRGHGGPQPHDEGRHGSFGASPSHREGRHKGYGTLPLSTHITEEQDVLNVHRP